MFYQIGDFVEYRPIGGASDNVSHSKGEIRKVFETGDGSVRYAINNKNTGKTSNYQVRAHPSSLPLR
jgi:sphingomyelin phosphodiesterase